MGGGSPCPSPCENPIGPFNNGIPSCPACTADLPNSSPFQPPLPHSPPPPTPHHMHKLTFHLKMKHKRKHMHKHGREDKHRALPCHHRHKHTHTPLGCQFHPMFHGNASQALGAISERHPGLLKGHPYVPIPHTPHTRNFMEHRFHHPPHPQHHHGHKKQHQHGHCHHFPTHSMNMNMPIPPPPLSH